MNKRKKQIKDLILYLLTYAGYTYLFIKALEIILK